MGEWLDYLRLKPTQPPTCVGAWVELGNKDQLSLAEAQVEAESFENQEFFEPNLKHPLAVQGLTIIFLPKCIFMLLTIAHPKFRVKLWPPWTSNVKILQK